MQFGKHTFASKNSITKCIPILQSPAADLILHSLCQSLVSIHFIDSKNTTKCPQQFQQRLWKQRREQRKDDELVKRPEEAFPSTQWNVTIQSEKNKYLDGSVWGLFPFLWRWDHSCLLPFLRLWDAYLWLTTSQHKPQRSVNWSSLSPRLESCQCVFLGWHGVGKGRKASLKGPVSLVKSSHTQLELEGLLGWALWQRSLQLISSALKNILT